MRLEDYPKEPRFAATVLKSEQITDQGADAEVRELVLEVDRDEFDFEIGQSVGVLVEGPQEFGGSLRQRLYTVADTPSSGGDTKPQITLVVRRCDYIDDYSGEQYPGVNSNFICDRKPGDKMYITGPFGLPFTVPEDKKANLLLIGLGTGIAPFRAFVKHIYQDIGDWEGRVRLLYGAKSGLELLYMNNKRDDFARYYDEDTFEAFQALSPRPNWADPHTYVYVAGLVLIRDSLDKVFANMLGCPESWAKKKAKLKEAGRWVELLY
jgi:ferredoxin--NADP+ reductase